jgi:hypothetical protein
VLAPRGQGGGGAGGGGGGAARSPPPKPALSTGNVLLKITGFFTLLEAQLQTLAGVSDFQDFKCLIARPNLF